MERFVRKFWTEEDGNITVDWIVLTAGLVLLGSAVMASVATPSENLADNAGEAVEYVAPTLGV